MNKIILLGDRTAEYIDFQHIYISNNKFQNHYTKSTIKTYLSCEIKNGSIFDAGKGWYSNLPNAFTLETSSIKKIITDLKKPFPLLTFQAWSTAQINAYTQHLLTKQLTFISTESDAMESVADELRAKDYLVYVNPGKADVEKHFRIQENTVVIRPSISKEPVGENHAAPVEKILVDLVWESKHLKFIDELEAQEVVNNATAAGRIQMAALLGYVKRRVLDFGWLKTINQVQITKNFGDS